MFFYAILWWLLMHVTNDNTSNRWCFVALLFSFLFSTATVTPSTSVKIVPDRPSAPFILKTWLGNRTKMNGWGGGPQKLFVLLHLPGYIIQYRTKPKNAVWQNTQQKNFKCFLQHLGTNVTCICLSLLLSTFCWEPALWSLRSHEKARWSWWWL